MPADEIPLHTFDLKLFELQFPFAITGYQHPGSRMPNAHRHDFYEIHFITSGTGYHFIDFEGYKIEPNSLYFVSPGQVHFWKLEEVIEGQALVFTDDFLTFGTDKENLINTLSFFHSLESTPMLKLATSENDILSALLQQIDAEFGTPQLAQASVLRAYLHIFLTNIQRHYQPKVSSGNSNHYIQARKFKQLVSNNFIKERSIDYYAKALNMSSVQLHSIVKGVTGISPGQLIRNEVILEAKRLLTHTSLSVSEVAYKLAFNDNAYFGRYFKREVGLTPIQFKKSSLEKYHIF